MKKIIPLILILLMIFQLAGCSKKKIGDIELIDETNPLNILESDEHQLFESSAKPDMEFEKYYDYYAGFSFPYPKEWSVTVSSSNYIQIYNGDFVITIHHKPLTKETAWDDNPKLFMDGFETMIESEKFTLKMYSGIYRRSRQALDEINILSDEPVMISETFDDVKMTTGLGDYINNKFCEKRYYLRYNNMDSLISIIGDIEKKDEAYKLIDYIVGEMRETGVYYEQTKMISTDSDSFLIPTTFSKHQVKIGDIVGNCYAPAGSDAYAGCFIETFPMISNVDYDFIDKAFKAALPTARKCLYNDSDVYNFEMEGEVISCFCTISDGTENSITPNGLTWNLEIHNGGHNIIIVGYPIAKGNLINLLSQQEIGGV